MPNQQTQQFPYSMPPPAYTPYADATPAPTAQTVELKTIVDLSKPTTTTTPITTPMSTPMLTPNDQEPQPIDD